MAIPHSFDILQAVIEATPDAIFVKDLEGRYVIVNAAAARFLDRPVAEIVGKKDLYPGQLSGGQQQLVAVARAVIARPRLLLADEPTGALHSTQGQMIMDLLKQLNAEGTTIVQVTHNEQYAAMGRRVVSLFDGWLKEAA